MLSWFAEIMWRVASRWWAMHDYLCYVLCHKYEVAKIMIECGAPWGQALSHDLSKFSRAEFWPYVFNFFGDKYPNAVPNRFGSPFNPDTMKAVRHEFHYAWLHHQHNNPHHWEHWVLVSPLRAPRPLPMPEHYVLEMICDWYGAAKAKGPTGCSIREWYLERKDNFIFHDDTRKLVEDTLLANDWYCDCPACAEKEAQREEEEPAIT